jgi:hypothetical protein
MQSRSPIALSERDLSGRAVRGRQCLDVEIVVYDPRNDEMPSRSVPPLLGLPSTLSPNPRAANDAQICTRSRMTVGDESASYHSYRTPLRRDLQATTAQSGNLHDGTRRTVIHCSQRRREPKAPWLKVSWGEGSLIPREAPATSTHISAAHCSARRRDTADCTRRCTVLSRIDIRANTGDCRRHPP